MQSLRASGMTDEELLELVGSKNADGDNSPNGNDDNGGDDDSADGDLGEADNYSGILYL